MNLGRIAGAVQALAINAVTIYGVFGLKWPVGTAIALYWWENVLRAVVIVVLLFVWRKFFRRGDSPVIVVRPDFTMKKFFSLALLFNAVHAVFLLVILGLVVPRMSPAQRFEGSSFQQGVVIVSILLAIELLVWLVSASRSSDAQIQLTASAYLPRVVVLHLTIVFGMFGIVLFNHPAALFGSFAALKVLAELALQIRRA